MTEAGCLRIPLAAYPGFNRFTLDWMAGDPNATQFLERRRPAGWTAAGSAASPELATALIESNRRWGRNVEDEVARWSRGETFTVIAGQQVGFAGGPIYTLAKLAGMLKLKRDNEARGIPTTVFFWLATEDHDFAEVATLSLPKRDPKQQLDLTTFRARHRMGKMAVGALPVPEELTLALIEFLDIPRPSWLREGITFRDSFAELITSAVDGKFILVDALLPELRRAGAPLFDDILTNWERIQRALDTRAEELTKAGYAPQVLPRPGEAHTLLFDLDEHGRRHLLESPQTLPPPERTSTSALTRPLLQDFVLRPDVFVGGPSEVAYYAQIAPLHEMLNVPMPRVALRAHELLAPKRLARTVERYDIKPEEIFAGTDAVLATREPAGVAEVKAIAEKAKRALAADITRIGEIALPAEHALARAINKSIGHIEYHFAKLTERAIRGLARKDRERYAAVRELVATLVPDGALQDRVTGWFGYWQQYGSHLIESMIANAEQDEDVCKVVSL
ncbi:MAG: bacillithiol biosynthesis BshC [Acidobacteria bacterium]|nr:bacillithiol biosynthesis BshC [Acidobacteriota bacterium]MBV9068255.1 bacillithiol biosynthesis BshC [Acidobacteriota bacterium]MBV9185063.1 bacillithiol biosynthesis BshC [Acidobacteriota bacterium]